MIVVAGPPGSGKSSAFPLADFGIDFFNVDDAAANLNFGDYLNIPLEIRRLANRQCEEFITEHIRARNSFAIETTLRQDITFQQTRSARAAGFLLVMVYVVVKNANEAIKRVANRVEEGGHPAPPKFIRESYRASIDNLPIAIRQFDHVFVFDNTRFDAEPQVIIGAANGGIYFTGAPVISWLRRVVKMVATLRLQPSSSVTYKIKKYRRRSRFAKRMFEPKVTKRVWEAAFATARILERNPYAGERNSGGAYPKGAVTPFSHPLYVLPFVAYGEVYGLAYVLDPKQKVAIVLGLFAHS